MREEQLLLSSNRKAKSINSQSKKLNYLQQKIVKKSLSSAFTPFTENDAVSDLSEKESSQISSISTVVDEEEVSDNGVTIQHPEVSSAFVPYEYPAGQSREFESSIVSLNQFISPSSVKSGLVEMRPLPFTKTVELSPASSTITTEDAAVFVTSDEAATEEMTSFETISLVKLRESMLQVLHPADIKPMYKKLLEELVKMEECYGLHEERGMISNLFSRKAMIRLLSFGLGIFVVFTCYFLFTDVPSSSYGPPPT